MAKVSASLAINAAFSSIQPGWQAAWGAIGLFAASNTALQVWGASVGGDAATWTNKAGILAHLGSLALAAPIVILLIASSVIAYGALYRSGLGQSEDLGPAGLQWRGVEWRVLGATALVCAVVIPVFAAWMAAIIVPFSIGAAAHKPSGQNVELLWIGLSSFIVLPLYVWAAVRLSPFLAATVDQKRVVLFKVWPLTRGSFWAIFGALFVVGFVSGLIGVIGQVLALAIKGLEGAIVHATALQSLLPALVQSLAAVAFLPAKVGLMVYIYRTLRPDQTRVADVFS